MTKVSNQIFFLILITQILVSSNHNLLFFKRFSKPDSPRRAGRIPVIGLFAGDAGIELIALGGNYSRKFNGFFGMVTEDSLSRLRADLAFISAPAVAGLQAFHMDDNAVRAKRAMMAVADRKVLLVNHQRFGRSALQSLARLTDFDTIITELISSASAP